MSPSDPPPAAASATKKKNNKKKKKNATAKANGDAAVTATSLDAAKEVDAVDEEGEGDGEEADESTVNSPTDAEHPKPSAEDLPNGNGHSPEPTDVPSHDAADTTDTAQRLAAMTQDREALRAEVEQLRKSLEGLQEKHTEEIAAVRTELDESNEAKEQALTQYQNLLVRVNTIRSSLGERLAADRQELEEAREQIEELEGQNQTLKSRVEELDAEATTLKGDAGSASQELDSLRERHKLSQHNWMREREDVMQQLKHMREEADAAKEAMGDWEVLAREERKVREGLSDRVGELEEELQSYKTSYERAADERDMRANAVDGLQKALNEIQEARKRELREMVETSQEQLDAANKLVQQAETRATAAETAKADLEKELERTAPFEKEVKEKNLLIGKLRHEAIVLNDHLTKALRFLKKAKPEDNIDRQIVTNHFLHFITLDRTDPKKFQVLQLIAALLNWTDEQREQAGLARPGASSSSGGSLRVPLSPFHRTPSTPSLNSDFFPDPPSATSRESLAELWTGFLERQAEEAVPSKAGAAGASTAPPK